MKHNFDQRKQEVLRRALKYIIIGLVVGLAAMNIPKQKIDSNEVVMIGITASCVFAIIAMYAPTIVNMVDPTLVA